VLKAPQEILAQLALPVRLGLLELAFKDQQARPEQRVPLVRLAQRVLLAQQDLLVLKVLLALQALRVQPVLKAR
jgi:hypothetical protein